MSNPNHQATAADKERRRKRLELRIGAMVQIALEDDKIEPADVFRILTAEAEIVKRLLPS